MRRTATGVIIGTLLLGFVLSGATRARAQTKGMETGFESWPASGVSVIAQSGGGTTDLVVEEGGETAWVVLGPRIVAVDLSDPERPLWRGASEPLPGFVLDLTLLGEHLVVSLRAVDDRGDRILVLNRDVDAPEVVGGLVLPTPTRDRAFGAEFGLVALDGRIQALDLRDPIEPRLIAGSVVGPAFRGASFPGSLAVAGRRGYAHIGAEVVALAIEDEGLRVLGSWPMGGSMMEAFEGGLLELQVMGDTPGRILDTTDPSAPREIAAFTVEAGSLFARRDHQWRDQRLTLLYGRLEDAVLLDYDLSDPTSPRLSARATTADRGMGVVAGAGELLLVSDGAGELHVRRVRGDDLVRAGSLRDPVGSPFRVLLRGDLAVVADSRGNLRALDIADPARPRLLAERAAHTSAAPPTNLHLMDDVVWMATDELVAWDLSDRQRPRTRKRIPLGDLAGELLVEDGVAFVGGGRAGIHVFDISDVTAVTRLAHWEGLDVPRLAWLARQGQQLWVGGYDGTFGMPRSPSLQLFDIADLAAPRTLAGGAQSVLITDVASEDGVAVAAMGSGQRRWIETLRVAGQRIESLGQLDLFDASGVPMSRMHLVKGHLYVASGGMQIVDVSVPSAPDALGYLRAPGGAADLSLDGQRVALAQGGAGLIIARIDGDEPGPGSGPGSGPPPEPPAGWAATIHLPWLGR
jgi:hypothetical protein